MSITDKRPGSTPAKVETMRWVGAGDGLLHLIDQTRLPDELVEIECRELEVVWQAIKRLQVRGAPAIGIAAAYGVVLGAKELAGRNKLDLAELLKICDYLATSRPTAVNLFWALDRMREKSRQLVDGGNLATNEVLAGLLEEARAIHEEDRQMCHAIGRNGVPLLQNVRGVLTHCNAGGLATAEYGTALSVFFTAQDQGIDLHVYVDETRPLLQGARLTAWELLQRGIRATLICDSMAAQVMREGRVQAAVVGADRIAANGDTANKIGTYGVALLCKAHGIPFYVAAPSCTFDLTIESGNQIPIEQRDASEIKNLFGKRTAPDGIEVYNPAFDVTPAELIAAIITERGVIQPVSRAAIAQHLRTI
ncbi:MAG: S-methyl-5-thioribose-1-phosphate isomerase [Pirellulaceae bacterium]